MLPSTVRSPLILTLPVNVPLKDSRDDVVIDCDCIVDDVIVDATISSTFMLSTVTLSVTILRVYKLFHSLPV